MTMRHAHATIMMHGGRECAPRVPVTFDFAEVPRVWGLGVAIRFWRGFSLGPIISHAPGMPAMRLFAASEGRDWIGDIILRGPLAPGTIIDVDADCVSQYRLSLNMDHLK